MDLETETDKMKEKIEGDWMEILVDEYDEESGLPLDRTYLECGLPAYLQESLEQMKVAWKKIDCEEDYLHWDCDFCNLQSDINSAEVEGMISSEQAWYLREKYLRISRPNPDDL